MNSDHEELPGSGGVEMSLPGKIAGVFLDPRRTFVGLDRKPDFTWPLVIMMVVSLVAAVIIWPLIAEIIMEKMSEVSSGQPIPEETGASVLKIQRIIALAGAPISVLLTALIIAGVLMFAGNVLVGGQAPYRKLLSIYAYSSLIGIISTALFVFLALSRGTVEVYLSPAAFFPVEAKEQILFKIAAIFDIFVIWRILVLSVGMGVVYRMTFQKALSVIGSLYLIFSALRIIISGAF